MRILRILFILTAFTWGIVAQSQPASHTNNEWPHAQQPESARGIANAVLPIPQTIQIISGIHNDIADKKHDESEPRRFSCQWWLNWVYKFIDDPIVLFTFVLAISTIFLWRDTRGLRLMANQQSTDMKESLNIAKAAADTAKRTVDAMEATAELQLRAYVFVEADAIRSVEDGKIPASTTLIKNTGLTPAYDVKHWGGISIVKNGDEPPDFSDAENEFEGPVQIAPNGELIVNNIYDKKLTESDIKNLKSKECVIYVYGRITYTDIFNKPHWTTYRTTQDGDVRSPIGGHFLTICERGNSCDRE